MALALAYTGPQCPRCGIVLTADYLRNGIVVCHECGRPYEATLFTPPERPRVAVAETHLVAGPAEANACANHARNAAVTSCARCGLFICSLCEMNVGTGAYCPSCFDRVRAEGTLKPVATRYRDWASIARLTAIIGLLFYIFWPFVGGLALFFSIKGMRQRKEQGRSRIGMAIVMLIAIGEIVAGLVIYGFMIWAFSRGVSQGMSGR